MLTKRLDVSMIQARHKEKLQTLPTILRGEKRELLATTRSELVRSFERLFCYSADTFKILRVNEHYELFWRRGEHKQWVYAKTFTSELVDVVNELFSYSITYQNGKPLTTATTDQVIEADGTDLLGIVEELERIQENESRVRKLLLLIE